MDALSPMDELSKLCMVQTDQGKMYPHAHGPMGGGRMKKNHETGDALNKRLLLAS